MALPWSGVASWLAFSLSAVVGFSVVFCRDVFWGGSKTALFSALGSGLRRFELEGRRNSVPSV